MFSVYIKGSRHHNDADMVKLTMIFYRNGHNRVPKVLNISGLYADWDHKTRSFKPTSGENISKNNLLQKERIKFLNIAERWEYAGKNWLPAELAHVFDKDEERLNRYKSVSQVFDELIEESINRERVRNGKIFSGIGTARYLGYVKKSLERFTLSKYGKAFSKYNFRDIDNRFLQEYTSHEQLRGSKSGTQGGIYRKLVMLYSVCETAKTKGIYNVRMSAFHSIRTKLRPRRFFSKAVSHETILRIENMDRVALTKHERLHIDLFLFSYYAGGMSGIDVCHMERSWIKGGAIEYDRTKYDNRVRIILTDKAAEIIERYRKESYMQYVFPIFKKRIQSIVSRYDRVHFVTKCVNATLKKVCGELGIENITWSSARSSFISKLLDDGFHIMQVAEQTGNSPQTISKHYYGITNRDEVRKRMNELFSSPSAQ